MAPAGPRRLRVLIADGDRLYAERLRLRLASDRRIQIVGTCTDAARAAELVEVAQPDVIVLDAGFRGRERIEELWRDSLGASRLIVLTELDDLATTPESATVFVRKDRGVEAIAEDFFAIASLAELATPV